MKLSAEGFKLIKTHEGLRLEAYRCPAGVLTIGYGSTGPHVREGQVIGLHDADALLARDVERFERAVLRCTEGVALTQGQFDALVSFAFNVGEAALERSRLLRHLKAGEPYLAAAEFGKWVNGGGKVLPGLVKRRAAERERFLLGVA